MPISPPTRPHRRKAGRLFALLSRGLCLPLLLSSGCLLPPWSDFDVPATGATESGTDSASGTDSDPGETSISSVTITASGGETDSDGTDGTDSDGTDSDGTDSDGDGEMPAILDLAITPDVALSNGPLAVTVHATNSEGVRLEFGADYLSGIGEVELAEIEPGLFEGELPVLTGLDKGLHTAFVFPWKGEEEGASASATYEIDFAVEPGVEGYWDAGDMGEGTGQVNALAWTPNTQWLIELTTSTNNGTSSCTLRRREKNGAWGQDDFMVLMPGENCKAIDLEIGADGVLYALVSIQQNTGWRWRLIRMASWNATKETLANGSKHEAAYALAEQAGTLAICGTAPTGEADLSDVMVRIVRPDDQLGQSMTFDYWPSKDEEDEHKFQEVARGCDFVGTSLQKPETLVVVGNVFGKHDKDNDTKFNRRFDLFYSLSNNTGTLHVAEAEGLIEQSFASDVDVAADGRIMMSGYICALDLCLPTGRLWMLNADTTLGWSALIGVYPSSFTTPAAVRWSPAGYVVVASGGPKESPTAFLLRAYKPGNAAALWTYLRDDSPSFSQASALAISKYGDCCGGGLGENNYPAVACVGS